jgi:hypothetical protein
MTTNALPVSDVDLWTAEVMPDPYPIYRQLRDTGGRHKFYEYCAVEAARERLRPGSWGRRSTRPPTPS